MKLSFPSAIVCWRSIFSPQIHRIDCRRYLREANKFPQLKNEHSEYSAKPSILNRGQFINFLMKSMQKYSSKYTYSIKHLFVLSFKSVTEHLILNNLHLLHPIQWACFGAFIEIESCISKFFQQKFLLNAKLKLEFIEFVCDGDPLRFVHVIFPSPASFQYVLQFNSWKFRVENYQVTTRQVP